MEDSALHQGIFIQKPKPKSTKRKLPDERIRDETMNAFGGHLDTANLRYSALKNHWEHVQENMMNLETKWHEDLVKEIGLFIEENASKMFESELVTPIGFLQTGLSADENMNLFESITNAIKEGVTTHVARLKSTMCPNVKTAFQNICKQLIKNNLDVSRFNETCVSSANESSSSLQNEEHISSSNRYLSMHDLQKWYESRYNNYYKNQLTKNSPAYPQMKVASIPLSRIDYSEIYSPGTPTSKRTPLMKPRRSLAFGHHRQNENIKVDRGADKGMEIDEIRVEDQDLSTPKKKDSDRKLRSSSSQKKDNNSNKELNASTPSLSRRVSRKCFPDSPDRKELPSPILEDSLCNTPKRIKPSEAFSTPLRCKIRTPVQRTPRCLLTSTGIMPIVLVIDDVDYFPANVIQQIFQLLSCAKLPLILVVGVIHYYESFNRFVPQQCSTTLMYKTFSTVTASTRLNGFFHTIMYMPEFPMILSGRIIEYLSDYFLLHHFSITRLLQAYKLCLLDYYRLPKSLLCLKDFKDVLSDISPEDLLEMVRSTNIDLSKLSASMSLRTPTKGRIVPSTNIKGDVCAIVEKFHPSCIDWFVSLHFLYGLCTGLPNAPLGRDIRDLYIHCFEGDLFNEYDNEPSRFDRALVLMELLQQGELLMRLTRSKKMIEDYVSENNANKTEFVNDLIQAVEKFVGKVENIKEEERRLAEDGKNNGKVPPLSLKKFSKKKASWYEVRQDIKKSIDEGKGISSLFTNLRKTVIDFVRRTTREHLRSFPSKLQEIFVYDNLQYIQSHFSPSPHEKVHEALSFPVRYLQCKCCSGISAGSVDASLPDTSIVYKLLLEKTYKTVDLNEIYESFLSIVETKVKKRVSTSKVHNGKNEKYLLRFRQAAAELQHMGFILRSKQKPDEVTRQAW